MRTLVSFVSMAAASAVAVTAASGQTALLHLNGNSAGDNYGTRIEELSAGFVFAPDYELVVGVPDDDTNGVDAGRVDVRNAATGTLRFSLFGTNAGDRFGSRVAQADLNGDGRVDYLLVGADQRGTGNPGYLGIYDPGQGGSLGRVDGTVAGSEFGASLTVLRDLNGDAVNDYAVGAPAEDVGSLLAAGAVHIISGVNNLEIMAFGGTTAGGRFGWSLHTLDDVDGDLTTDFAVSAPSDAGVGSVTAYSQSIPPVLVWQSVGATALEDFGETALVVGDYDGDAVRDLLVGAPAIGDPGQNGRVALISGATGAQIVDVAGANPADRFGAALQIGDVNRNGVDDAYVGAPGVDGAGSNRGEVLAYSLVAPGVFTFVTSIAGDLDDDAFATSLAVLPISPRPILGDYLAIGVPGHDEPLLADVGQTVVFSTVDSPATVQNYGAGWPGTLGIPNISAGSPPAFETSITVTIDNSAGVPTLGLLLVGFVPASILTGAGGTILVSPPWILQGLGLPVGQVQITGPVPTDVRFCGLTVDLQLLELDPGASHGISFTPGLELTFGG